MERYEKRLKRGTKTRIMKRDESKCVICDTWHNLVVHHYWDGFCNPMILPPKEHQTPYWDTRDEELITLCRTCHMKIHHNPCSRLAKLLGQIVADRVRRVR